MAYWYIIGICFGVLLAFLDLGAGRSSDTCSKPRIVRYEIFAKVIAWDESEVHVKIISKFLAFSDAFTTSRIRQKETWSFGTFCIALSYLNPERKHLAYVSPYTRAHSHPFRKDPEPCAPEQVIANKRKHN